MGKRDTIFAGAVITETVGGGRLAAVQCRHEGVRVHYAYERMQLTSIPITIRNANKIGKIRTARACHVEHDIHKRVRQNRDSDQTSNRIQTCQQTRIEREHDQSVDDAVGFAESCPRALQKVDQGGGDRNICHGTTDVDET